MPPKVEKKKEPQLGIAFPEITGISSQLSSSAESQDDIRSDDSSSLYIGVFLGKGTDEVHVVPLYRGDGRAPNSIFEQGFTARGTNLDLEGHVFPNYFWSKDSAYVATSTSKSEAKGFAEMAAVMSKKKPKTGYLYEINPQKHGLDVVKELNLNTNLAQKLNINCAQMFEQEIAVPVKIAGKDIKGVWSIQYNESGRQSFKLNKYIHNPHYQAPFHRVTQALMVTGRCATAVGVIFDSKNLYLAYQRSQKIGNYDHLFEEGARIIGGWSGAIALGTAIGKTIAAINITPAVSLAAGVTIGISGSIAAYQVGSKVAKAVVKDPTLFIPLPGLFGLFTNQLHGETKGYSSAPAMLPIDKTEVKLLPLRPLFDIKNTHYPEYAPSQVGGQLPYPLKQIQTTSYQSTLLASFHQPAQYSSLGRRDDLHVSLRAYYDLLPLRETESDGSGLQQSSPQPEYLVNSGKKFKKMLDEVNKRFNPHQISDINKKLKLFEDFHRIRQEDRDYYPQASYAEHMVCTYVRFGVEKIVKTTAATFGTAIGGLAGPIGGACGAFGAGYVVEPAAKQAGLDISGRCHEIIQDARNIFSSTGASTVKPSLQQQQGSREFIITVQQPWTYETANYRRQLQISFIEHPISQNTYEQAFSRHRLSITEPLELHRKHFCSMGMREKSNAQSGEGGPRNTPGKHSSKGSLGIRFPGGPLTWVSLADAATTSSEASPSAKDYRIHTNTPSKETAGEQAYKAVYRSAVLQNTSPIPVQFHSAPIHDDRQLAQTLREQQTNAATTHLLKLNVHEANKAISFPVLALFQTLQAGEIYTSSQSATAIDPSKRKIRIIVHTKETKKIATVDACDALLSYTSMDVTVEIHSGRQGEVVSLPLEKLNHQTTTLFDSFNESDKVELFFTHNQDAVNLPQDMNKHFIHFLKRYKPLENPYYCCLNFACEMAIGRAVNIEQESIDFNFERFDETTVQLGDVVFLKQKASSDLSLNTFLEDLFYPFHVAIYIGAHQYLSLMGWKGPLIVATMAQMEKIYETKFDGSQIMRSIQVHDPRHSATLHCEHTLEMAHPEPPEPPKESAGHPLTLFIPAFLCSQLHGKTNERKVLKLVPLTIKSFTAEGILNATRENPPTLEPISTLVGESDKEKKDNEDRMNYPKASDRERAMAVGAQIVTENVVRAAAATTGILMAPAGMPAPVGGFVMKQAAERLATKLGERVNHAVHAAAEFRRATASTIPEQPPRDYRAHPHAVTVSTHHKRHPAPSLLSKEAAQLSAQQKPMASSIVKKATPKDYIIPATHLFPTSPEYPKSSPAELHYASLYSKRDIPPAADIPAVPKTYSEHFHEFASKFSTASRQPNPRSFQECQQASLQKWRHSDYVMHADAIRQGKGKSGHGLDASPAPAARQSRSAPIFDPIYVGPQYLGSDTPGSSALATKKQNGLKSNAQSGEGGPRNTPGKRSSKGSLGIRFPGGPLTWVSLADAATTSSEASPSAKDYRIHTNTPSKETAGEQAYKAVYRSAVLQNTSPISVQFHSAPIHDDRQLAQTLHEQQTNAATTNLLKLNVREANKAMRERSQMQGSASQGQIQTRQIISGAGEVLSLAGKIFRYAGNEEAANFFSSTSQIMMGVSSIISGGLLGFVTGGLSVVFGLFSFFGLSGNRAAEKARRRARMIEKAIRALHGIEQDLMVELNTFFQQLEHEILYVGQLCSEVLAEEANLKRLNDAVFTELEGLRDVMGEYFENTNAYLRILLANDLRTKSQQLRDYLNGTNGIQPSIKQIRESLHTLEFWMMSRLHHPVMNYAVYLNLSTVEASAILSQQAHPLITMPSFFAGRLSSPLGEAFSEKFLTLPPMALYFSTIELYCKTLEKHPELLNASKGGAVFKHIQETLTIYRDLIKCIKEKEADIRQSNLPAREKEIILQSLPHLAAYEACLQQMKATISDYQKRLQFLTDPQLQLEAFTRNFFYPHGNCPEGQSNYWQRVNASTEEEQIRCIIACNAFADLEHRQEFIQKLDHRQLKAVVVKRDGERFLQARLPTNGIPHIMSISNNHTTFFLKTLPLKQAQANVKNSSSPTMRN